MNLSDFSGSAVEKSLAGDAGEYPALRPKILSVSRTTDIPAFYPEWIINRLNAGYSVKLNPYNRMKRRIIYDDVGMIVFWSKNPSPLISYLPEIDRKGIRYYFQFTLNDYDCEGFERNVPPLSERIETFKKMSDVCGPEKVIWRFDPLLLSDTVDVEILVARIEEIGEEISPYTEKFVFSFIDLYKSVERNLKKSGIKAAESLREFSFDEVMEMSDEIGMLTGRWGIRAATCGEDYDLKCFGIEKNRCVDPDLISRICVDDPDMTRYLSRHAKKDKGQRPACGCIESSDVGCYNTCPHLCAYCYANRFPEKVKVNYRACRKDPLSESLCP
jgi:DNA repair photolyase